MTISVTIAAETHGDLITKIKHFLQNHGAAAETSAEESAPAARKPRAAKSDKTPETTASVPAEEKAKEGTFVFKATDGKKLTKEEKYKIVSDTTMELVAAAGKAEVVALLGTYGAAKADQIPEDKWDEFLGKVQDKLDAAKKAKEAKEESVV